MSVVPIQQQEDTNSCGLFSIAAAYHAAVRSDIGLLTFNESRLRAHLIKCFEQKKLTRFPQSKKLCVTQPASQNVIVVYCPCKKPDSFQNMIQCDQCGVWFLWFVTLCTLFFKCEKLCFCCKIILSIFTCLVTILITEGVLNLHKHVLGFLYGVTILMRF